MRLAHDFSRTRRLSRRVGLVLLSLAAFLTAAATRAQRDPSPTFTHPDRITHPYLPLSRLLSDVLAGKEDGKPLRVVRTVCPTRKTFRVNGKTVTPLAVEDREFTGSTLKEVTTDYFAQDDAGAVYYLGEDVDEYRNGTVVGHAGVWQFGKGRAALGILLLASPKVGDRFRSEDVPGVTTEEDEVVSTTETVTTPAGRYTGCVRVREKLSDGAVEYKVYARGIGMVVDDSLRLTEHTARP